jgi:hypothetical protein
MGLWLFTKLGHATTTFHHYIERVKDNSNIRYSGTATQRHSAGKGKGKVKVKDSEGGQSRDT